MSLYDEAYGSVELRISWRHAFDEIRRTAFRRECSRCHDSRIMFTRKAEPRTCWHLWPRLKFVLCWLALGAGLRVACDGGSIWGYRWFWEEPRYLPQDLNAG